VGALEWSLRMLALLIGAIVRPRPGIPQPQSAR
jgi:hypothetical protein